MTLMYISDIVHFNNLIIHSFKILCIRFIYHHLEAEVLIP